MKYAFTLLPFALTALAIAPQASPVPGILAPGGPPPGCSPSYSGGFTIINTRLPGARKRTPPQEGPASPLTLTLANGILEDGEKRFGYIASNHQYQFDNPIQAGAIYTEGWSACPNNTLALGGSTTFYQCISGNFYNLYDKPIRSGCIPIEFAIIAAAGASGVVSTPPASTPPASTPPASTPPAASTPAPPVTTPAPPATTPAPPPPASTPAPPPPATSTVAPATSAAPASSAAPATPSYTGAASPLAVEGSFFAMAAGAAVLAMF